MRRLPLFPLPVVLLPGDVIPLHIFEPRYRQMVARCLEYDRQFGLVYHDADRFGPFELLEGRVATLAQIGEFRILPGGRSLLLAHGIERIQIVDGIESELPYREALVAPFHDPLPEDPLALRGQREQTLEAFKRVLERLRKGTSAESEPFSFEEEGLPDPSEEVSFRLAARIRTDPSWLDKLLRIEGESERLVWINTLLEEAERAAHAQRSDEDPTQ